MEAFRINLSGKLFDIPSESLSQATIERLKSLLDSKNFLESKDLLKAFLEISEIANILKNNAEQSIQKLESLQKNS